MSRQTVSILALMMLAVASVIATLQSNKPTETTETIVSLAAGKEMAKAISIMNHRMWPDGTIIHKELGNGWVCVEIDGNHLLIRKRGRSSFGVAVDSCLED